MSNASNRSANLTVLTIRQQQRCVGVGQVMKGRNALDNFAFSRAGLNHLFLSDEMLYGVPIDVLNTRP